MGGTAGRVEPPDSRLTITSAVDGVPGVVSTMNAAVYRLLLVTREVVVADSVPTGSE